MNWILRIILILGWLSMISQSKAQQLETRFSATGTGGVISNTFLTPGLAEWDRTTTGAYYSLIPVGSLRWAMNRRTVTLTAGGQLFDQRDDRSAWLGGFANTTITQRITGNWTAELTGGLNFHQAEYSRNMQWAHVKLNRLLSTSTRASVQAGSSWRTYRFEEESNSDRYDTYGLELEHWPNFNWRVYGRFFSSFAHITDPSRGFSAAIGTGYRPSENLNLTLQVSMDQFTEEFQLEGEGGMASTETHQPGVEEETFVMEDQLYRGIINARYRLNRNLALTGRVAGMGWSSNIDDQFITDFEMSAGVEVSIAPDFSSNEEIREIEWEEQNREEYVVEVRYRGSGRLFITGDFNDWDDPGIPLTEVTRNRYQTEVNLSAGSHEYKIRVRRNSEDEWLDLPASAATTSDGFGGRNGRIIVDF